MAVISDIVDSDLYEDLQPSPWAAAALLVLSQQNGPYPAADLHLPA